VEQALFIDKELELSGFALAQLFETIGQPASSREAPPSMGTPVGGVTGAPGWGPVLPGSSSWARAGQQQTATQAECGQQTRYKTQCIHMRIREREKR
jgi:hypothetical protein